MPFEDDNTRLGARPQAPGHAGVGPVTFLPDTRPSARAERWIIGLLATIALLLAALVGGGLYGAVVLSQEIGRMQTALDAQATGLKRQADTLAATSKELSHELVQRQGAFSTELMASNRDRRAELAALDRRRAALGAIPADPFKKADYAIEISLIALDEAIVNNRFWTTTQAAAAKAGAPLPAQGKIDRKLVPTPRNDGR